MIDNVLLLDELSDGRIEIQQLHVPGNGPVRLHRPGNLAHTVKRRHNHVLRSNFAANQAWLLGGGIVAQLP